MTGTGPDVALVNLQRNMITVATRIGDRRRPLRSSGIGSTSFWGRRVLPLLPRYHATKVALQWHAPVVIA